MENRPQSECQSHLMDLQQLGSKDLDSIPEDELRCLGQQLIDKAKSFGLVGFKNHGLPLECVTSFLDASKKFFDLPRDEKLKHPRDMTTTLQGFTDSQTENLNTNNPGGSDVKETFNITNVEFRMPEQVPELKLSAKESMDTLWLFTTKLFRLLELGLDWKPGTLSSLHSGPTNNLTTLRALSYPSTSSPPGTIRCGAHKDVGTFSLQFQTSKGGFETLQNNEWKNSDVEEGVISFFFGQSMRVLSGDELQATMHRVVVTDDDSQRLSAVYFVHIDREKMLQSYSGPVRYEPVNAFDFAMKKVDEIVKRNQQE